MLCFLQFGLSLVFVVVVFLGPNAHADHSRKGSGGRTESLTSFADRKTGYLLGLLGYLARFLFLAHSVKDSTTSDQIPTQKFQPHQKADQKS
jgi:hypothetical protein